MPLVRVRGRSSDALVDHADGRRGHSCLPADAFRARCFNDRRRAIEGPQQLAGNPWQRPDWLREHPARPLVSAEARPSGCRGKP